jgi:hypothetical protein
MNEFYMKSNYEYFMEQMAKLAWKRGCLGNSQERKTAPVSFRKDAHEIKPLMARLDDRIFVPMKYLPLAAVCLLLAGCSKSSNSPSGSSEPECGVERWHVKILTDPAVSAIHWTPVMTTLAEQNSYPEISVSEDTTRMAFEDTVVTVKCTITAFVRESDKDIHLIIVDSSRDSMIAEIPSTQCAEVAASAYASEFDAAAQWVTNHLGTPSEDFKNVNVSATITGVLFQDFNHGQDGHARNYREIHPVTKIE